MNLSNRASAATQAGSRVTALVSFVLQKITPPPPPPPLRMRNLPPNQPVSARRLAALLVFALGAFAVPTSHAQTAQEVPANWSLIPDGITSGGSFRLLFVTRGTHNAASTDIGVYNTFVQNQANNAIGSGAPIVAFSGEFRAVISTAARDARDNIAAIGTGVPIYWLGSGDKVADNYAGFYSGTWGSIVARNQRGNTFSSRDVWTGSNNNGTEKFENTTSRAAGTSTVTLGVYDTPGRVIDGNRVTDASASHSLYALSPLITVSAFPDL